LDNVKLEGVEGMTDNDVCMERVGMLLDKEGI
jgi:hypothetical protein